MYIESITIENLKSISSLHWELGARRPEGWHVILGDNGTGKTTFLRGVCFALLGESAEPLVPDWTSYVRDGEQQSTCEVLVRTASDYDIPQVGASTGIPATFYGGLRIKRQEDGGVEVRVERKESGRVEAADYTGPAKPQQAGDLWRLRPNRFYGWFSAAYGPFRRFTGGDRDEQERLFARPAVGRHMSVFAERVALTKPIEWLIGLHTEQLDTGKQSELLQQIIKFVNQDDFLPNGVRFDRVTSKDVLFTDAGGATVKIEDLSDGYRSVLCMTLELLRQLSLAYPTNAVLEQGEAITVAVPGVVLIDEVDVHLHPSWQRTIGLWFRKYFPKIQFIVTTHSPLVCQAAEHGTVFALCGADSEDQSHFVEGADLERLLYGDILDAYSTELFGTDVDRSPQAQELINRLAQLNIAEIDRDLTQSEKKEQKDLRRKLPTSAYTVSS